MFFTIEKFKRKIQSIFGAKELIIRLLRLKEYSGPQDSAGIVFIQIDGLGYRQIKAAADKGYMPFVSRIINDKQYTLKRSYSGLPSSTPSIQSALFYGARMTVPAFSYRDKMTGQRFHMFKPDSATALEERLEKTGVPLLKGGSSYGNVFAGGAEEVNFCISGMKSKRVLEKKGLLRMVLGIVLHPGVVFNIITGAVYELSAGMRELAVSIITRRRAESDFKNIPMRALVRTFLRDITVIGVLTDIKRGLPYIHINLSGYDEQAHHKGPEGALKRRYLLGIDRALKNIWKTSHGSDKRDYEVFIYSDHGQEKCLYFRDEFGMSLEEAVRSAVKKMFPEDTRPHTARSGSFLKRNGLFGFTEKKDKKSGRTGNKDTEYGAETESAGPIGHLYLQKELLPEEKRRLALLLVKEGKIPLAAFISGGRAYAAAEDGVFSIPGQAGRFLEKKHPFFSRVSSDLADLCAHPDSGDMILMGYRKDALSIAFTSEKGSHGGIGASETSGFMLLPRYAAGHMPPFPDAVDLRNESLRIMGGFPEAPAGRSAADPAVPKKVIRVMTYNVHSCIGRDGYISPERIARVIKSYDPDIVALQELKASETSHQARIIAELLSMTPHYHGLVKMKAGWHGNAVLSAYDIELMHGKYLPGIAGKRFSELRGAAWVRVNTGKIKINVFNTHMGFLPGEGIIQAKELTGPHWIGRPECTGPVILCGDFNSVFKSRAVRHIRSYLRHANDSPKINNRIRTFPSTHPFTMIDHIFVNEGITTENIFSASSGPERKASDHLPLIADLNISSYL